MYNFQTISLLALAGSAFAAPWGRHYEGPVVTDVHVVYQTAVKTVYVTEGQAVPTQPAAIVQHAHQRPRPSKSTSSAKIVYTTIVEAPTAPVSTPTPVVEAPKVETPTPVVYTTVTPQESSSAAPAPTTSQAPSYGTGYMATVAKWRVKLGKGALTQDSKLESNALNCVTESNGDMIHKLNPGSYGQVLAPGKQNDFENVFVGGWLCEVPSMTSELAAVCPQYASAWNYMGQTGHADILSSSKYTKIGCAWYNGIWACDVA